MSRYVWGVKAALRTSLLPCPACGAWRYEPCSTWWNFLVPLGFISHLERSLPSGKQAHCGQGPCTVARCLCGCSACNSKEANR